MVETRKLNIIRVVMSIDNDEALKRIEDNAVTIKAETEQPKPNVFDAVKPIREKVSLEQIVAEQNYKPISYQAFRTKADEIEWDVSLEELLEMLTK